LEITIDEVHAALRSRQTTCRELVAHYLQRIEAYDKSGPASGTTGGSARSSDFRR
jgi:Asp-tRNA(Asn)/Glu-tRNA(Gln) amidotransferase A subunit family amidase